jgi:hypothetical protein
VLSQTVCLWLTLRSSSLTGFLGSVDGSAYVLPVQVYARVVTEETSVTGEYDIDLFSVVYIERNKKKTTSLFFRLWDVRAAARPSFEDLKAVFKQPYIQLDLSKQWLVFDGFFQHNFYSGLFMNTPILSVCTYLKSMAEPTSSFNERF